MYARVASMTKSVTIVHLHGLSIDQLTEAWDARNDVWKREAGGPDGEQNSASRALYRHAVGWPMDAPAEYSMRTPIATRRRGLSARSL